MNTKHTHKCDTTDAPCEWERLYMKASAQRDDLLAALEALMLTESELRDPQCHVMRQARAAIARARGQE